jgi:hypothetical protein
MGKPKRGGAAADAAPLFAEDGELSAAFAAALREVFDRFAAGAPALDDAALNAFAAACNDGAAFAAEELEELKEALDCDEAGRLTWRGFTELYHTQSSARPEDTWRDMQRLGYDAQLRRQGGAQPAPTGAAAAAGGEPQAPPPAPALDARLAAVLPLVRAAKASGAADDAAAAREALDAACAAAPGGGGALAERLRAELDALHPPAAKAA